MSLTNAMYYVGAFLICVAIIVLCVFINSIHKITENQKRIIDHLIEIDNNTYQTFTVVQHIYNCVDVMQYDEMQRNMNND